MPIQTSVPRALVSVEPDPKAVKLQFVSFKIQKSYTFTAQSSREEFVRALTVAKSSTLSSLSGYNPVCVLVSKSSRIGITIEFGTPLVLVKSLALSSYV